MKKISTLFKRQNFESPKMKNLYDPCTEIVHLQGVDSNGTYTLCGLEYDQPDEDSFREEEDVMVETTKVCTCPICKEKAEEALNYLLHEYQRLPTFG